MKHSMEILLTQCLRLSDRAESTVLTTLPCGSTDLFVLSPNDSTVYGLGSATAVSNRFYNGTCPTNDVSPCKDPLMAHDLVRLLIDFQ